MVYEKHGLKFITNIANKSKKDLRNILKPFINHMGNEDSINQFRRQSDYNNFIVIVNSNYQGREPKRIMNTLSIPSVYMDSKRYSNGNPKVSREFQIVLDNFIDGLNLTDCNIISECAFKTPNISIFNFIDSYNKNSLNITELTTYLGGIGYTFPNIPKTHFYLEATKQYDSINYEYDNNKHFMFPLTKIVYCEYTSCNYLVLDGVPSGSTHNHSEAIQVSDLGWINQDYYFDNYTICSECGCNSDNDDTYYRDDDAYCEECYNDLESRDRQNSINYYSYKPTPRFYFLDKGNILKNSLHPNKKLNYGIELEIEARNYDVKLNDDAHYISNLFDGLFYCKEDSSIVDAHSGFEIVSHPITFNAIKKLDLENTLCTLQKDYKSFYARNCGMHIHISRDAFNDLQLYKFVLMMNSYKTLVHLVSQRRRISEYSGWCNFSDTLANSVKSSSASKIRVTKERIKYNKANNISRKLKLKYQASSTDGFRYSVVNLQNSSTIEVRSFKGNLKYSGFMKNIEFVDSMFNFCKYASLQDLNIESYIEFVYRDSKSYNNLVSHFDGNKSTLKHIIQNPNEDLR